MRYIVFDRTRHENFEKCPRLRLLSHEYPSQLGPEELTHMAEQVMQQVNGVDRQQLAIPLLTGGTAHKGLEAVATGQLEGEAVQIALDAYDRDITERGLELDEQAPEPLWTGKVQRVLCEALIRGWVRKVWPKLQTEFTVVDVEQEERLEIPVDEETILVLLTRSDLVMRRNADGRHFVFNHKTINEPTEKKLQSLRYDTQSISEVLAAQARYDMADTHPAVQIDGVIYDLLVKGPRKVEYPKGSGVWHNTSPLVWCYVKEGQTGITADEIAARWEYTCTAPHKMYRKECPGNANHKLGPQWHRKLVTEVFGSVEAWFEWLEENEPGLMDEQFQTLAPVMRSPWDVERWKRCVLTEEWAIADRADAAREAILTDGFSGAAGTLDGLFPLHTAHGNCFWPGKCPMWQVCWGGPVDDVLDIENNQGQPMFAPRKSNHPEAIVLNVGE